MRLSATVCCVLVLCGGAAGRKKQPGAPLPAQLEIGRLTFFDFGPPNEYYEVLVVRPQEEGSSVQRIILSPPGDACLQPAKIETISSLLRESVASLLENENPEIARRRVRFQRCPELRDSHVCLSNCNCCRFLNRGFAQELGRFFRRSGIDIETGAPFESGGLGQLGHKLDVPMVVVVG